MKYFALLLVVGLAAASGLSGSGIKFEAGKEYVFEYSGRLMTGIPALASQYSGLGINATVSLVAKTPTTFGLVVSTPKFVKINDVLTPVEDNVPSTYEGTNWRRVKLPEMVEVPAEFKKILAIPVVIELGMTGEVVKMVISKNEPEWSVNFKKGIVSLFQVKMETGVDSNLNEKPTFETLPYWKVMEQTVAGKCLATYQVNELPEYLIKQDPTLISFPESCPVKKYYEIVRTLDFDNCEKQASFSFYRPGHFMQKGASESVNNIESMLTRSSTTRRIACGSPATGLTIQTIVNDGEFDLALIGTKTERVVSGSLQTLRLKAVRPVNGGFPLPSDPVNLKHMMFEYTHKAYGITPQSVSSEQLSSEPLAEGLIPRAEIQEGMVLAKVIPRTFFQGLNHQTTPFKAEFVPEMVRMLKEVMTVIRGESSTIPLTESEINGRLLTVVRGMTTLETVEEIQTFYTTLVSGLNPEQTETIKQLFIDTIVMTGTPQAIEYFVKMVREGKVSQGEISSFFTFLPRYIMTPTQKIITVLFKLVTEVEMIAKVPTIYSLAITSLSQLVQSSCIAESRITAFPAHVFGEFCTPESEIIHEVVIPYLARALHKVPQTPLEEEVRNIHIIALGLIRHKHVIPELTPIIDTRLPVSTSTVEGSKNSASRVLAVYSLMSIGYQNPHLVIPVLTNVFTNPAEATEMRIAAFSSLLKLNPPKFVFDAIAAQTRMEPQMDLELLKIINIGLYTLGHQIPAEVIPTLPVGMIELVEKARLAYHMVKKTYGIVPTTAAFFKTEFLRDLGAGYTAQLAWISAHEQIMPRTVYVGLSLFLQKFYINVFQGGFMLYGSDSVLDQLSTVVSKVSGHKSEEVKSEIKRSIHTEFSKILEKLNIEAIKSEAFQANGLFQLAETGILFRSITMKTSELIKERIVEIMQNPTSLLTDSTELKINFQKTIDLSPMQVMFPSDMGFPVHVEVNAPVTVSVIGKAAIKPEALLPSISLTAQTILATQYSGVVSTVCPFTSEYLATGINQHSVINIPGAMEVKLDIPSQKLAVYVKPVTQTPTVLGHYHIMPYTTIGHINKLELLTKTPAIKPVKSIAPKKHFSATFGEMLGLGLKTEVVTESGFVDLKSIPEYIAIYKNPLNLILFGWTSPAMSEHLAPSVRFHKMTTLFVPSLSSTKELGVEIKVGVATKIMGESIIKYHTLAKKSLASLSKSEITEIMTNPTIGKLVSALIPLKTVSQPITTQVHQRRQQILKEVVGTLESASLESSAVTGVTLTTNLILMSTRPRTFAYVLTAAVGSKPVPESMKIHKEWNVVLESPVPQLPFKTISVHGHVTVPILPLWNIEKLHQALVAFDLHNEITLVRANGQKSSQIITTGAAKTTQAQKTFSMESPEALRLKEIISPISPVSPKTIVELEEIVRLQATALDKIVIVSEYVNVPKVFEQVEMKFIEILKVYLWPYYTPSYSSVENIKFESGSYKATTEVIFKQGVPTFDLKIVLPTEKVFFSNVRIAYPFNLFFPISAARIPISKVVSGSVLSAKSCMIHGKHLIKFNGNTMDIPATVVAPVVVAADCSTFHRFAIKAQHVQQGVWNTEIILKKNLIKVVPTPTLPTVLVNDKPIVIPVGKVVIVKDIVDHTVIAEVLMTPDHVVVVKAPRFLLEEVKTNGQIIEVVPSVQLKNKLCGVCGNFQKPIMTETVTGRCVYSKPELEIASWMIPTGSSSMMSPSILSELKKETEMCPKMTVLPTEVAKAYKVATGKCTILRHLIQKRPGQVCLSKIPVTQCGPSCKPQKSQLTLKAVPFTCLPEGPVVEKLITKVIIGQELPELATKVTSFAAQVRMPAHCVHALVTKGI